MLNPCYEEGAERKCAPWKYCSPIYLCDISKDDVVNGVATLATTARPTTALTFSASEEQGSEEKTNTAGMLGRVEKKQVVDVGGRHRPMHRPVPYQW